MHFEPKRSPFKLVLIDIDNTLLPDGSLDYPSRRNSLAMVRLARRVPIGLVTARQPWKTEYLINYLGLTGLTILSNGAQIYDPKTRKTVVERPLDKEVTMAVSRKLQDEGVGFWIQDNGVDHPFSNMYKPEKPFIIVAHRIDQPQEAKILNMMERFPPLTAYRSHAFVDGKVDVFITHRDSTKQQAIIDVADMMGISTEDVFAIGDGSNDWVLIRIAGFGVAMGNAVPEVRQVANDIVPSQEEDGVAVALERHILI